MNSLFLTTADPVYLNGFKDKVWLRIGGHGRGEGRVAILSPKEARILAYALLRNAELTPESPN